MNAKYQFGNLRKKDVSGSDIRMVLNEINFSISKWTEAVVTDHSVMLW